MTAPPVMPSQATGPHSACALCAAEAEAPLRLSTSCSLARALHRSAAVGRCDNCTYRLAVRCFCTLTVATSVCLRFPPSSRPHTRCGDASAATCCSNSLVYVQVTQARA